MRLDQLVHERGLAASRHQARALVMAGRVRVAGRVVDKPGTPLAPDAEVALDPSPRPWVGRGGRKLEGALDRFAIDVAGRIALDLGASTGGFTDCLLARGASRVYAVDVGRGQLDPRLRADPRVVVREGVNARNLGPEHVPEPVDLASADLAFISLRLVIPALVPRLAAGGEALLLVKPQFELERGRVGRGVVRDPDRHAEAVLRVAAAARAAGLAVTGVVPSPITGARGNREFFVRAGRAGADLGEALERAVAEAVAPGAGTQEAASK